MNLSDITFLKDNFEQLSMISIIEASKFEPEPTFENTINDIKDNHLKSINSTSFTLSDITSFDNKLIHLV